MIRPPEIDAGRELEDYLHDLVHDHEFRVHVTLLDNDEDELTRLTSRTQQLIDGSVTFDATQGADGVSRQLSITILDVKGRLHCDPDSPAAGAIGPGQFIQVTRGDFSNRLGKWVDVPVFHGPLTAFGRSGPEVTIEAMGKELYLLPPFGTPQAFTFNKGHPVRDVIHDLAAACGNTKFNLPRFDATLHKKLTVHKWEPVWPVIYKLAGQVNRNVFFNGRGVLTMKAKGANSRKFVFTGGSQGSVLIDTLPTSRWDFLSGEFVNTEIGVGADPKGQRKSPTVITTLANADPLSPVSLAWNGVALHAVEKVDNDNWKNTHDIKDANEHALKVKGNADTTSDFESLPIPCLEEFDVVGLNVDIENLNYQATFPLMQFTLPLASGQAMSVGSDRPRWRKAHHKTWHMRSKVITPPPAHKKPQGTHS